jgi:hypothetical protein
MYRAMVWAFVLQGRITILRVLPGEIVGLLPVSAANHRKKWETNMDDRQEETMLPTDRNRCPHCDPFQIRLHEVTRELDQIELKVERRCNELFMCQIAILLHGPGDDEQRPN